MLLTLRKGFNKSPVRFSTLNERIKDSGEKDKVIHMLVREGINCDCNCDHTVLIFTETFCFLAFALSFGFCHIQ